MNVLTCATCASPLTGPLRLLPEVPPRPVYEGYKNPDGSRHPPATVPRGAYAVDPEPSGEGCLMSAGPRGTLVTHPEDSRAHLTDNPALDEIGCCGPPGREGPNSLCAECGSVVATLYADCTGAYETDFLPDAVRITAV
ncbi:hypothetical protein ABZ896_05550 [Streptomyces sp. NPDC047072]|uniref:hypothetical protein n=1 Tax=Streptomyces sp. NPDC047072 TaxID=3154809 RepID=UPI0033F22C49